MKIKTITLSFIFAFFTLGVFAQEYEIPKNFKPQTAEDYAPFEQDVIKSFEWMMNTPFNEQKQKRDEATTFLLTWIMGSPNVTVELHQNILTFMESSPELLIIFMGGWTKYSLESKDFKNKIEGNLAGLEAVIEFYTKNKKFLSKDKKVEKYIKMKKKGTLKEYVEKNV